VQTIPAAKASPVKNLRPCFLPVIVRRQNTEKYLFLLRDGHRLEVTLSKVISRNINFWQRSRNVYLNVKYSYDHKIIYKTRGHILYGDVSNVNSHNSMGYFKLISRCAFKNLNLKERAGCHCDL
jgi:hypothetical protein